MEDICKFDAILFCNLFFARETSFELFLCKFGPIHKDTTHGAALLVSSLLLQNANADATSFYKQLSRALESTHLKHYR